MALSWQRGLHNSMKLWAKSCRSTQDGWVIVKSSNKTLEEGMASHSSILATRTTWTIWRGKKIWHQKMSPPGQKVSNMLLARSGGQLPKAPERMKRLGHDDVEMMFSCECVWWWKPNTVKNNIAYKPGMLGLRIRVTWTWSNRRWQEWTSTS